MCFEHMKNGPLVKSMLSVLDELSAVLPQKEGQAPVDRVDLGATMSATFKRNVEMLQSRSDEYMSQHTCKSAGLALQVRTMRQCTMHLGACKRCMLTL